MEEALEAEVERLRKKTENLPPVELEKVRKFIQHSFSNLIGYASLSTKERSILSCAEFEALRAWAFGRSR